MGDSAVKQTAKSLWIITSVHMNGINITDNKNTFSKHRI